LREWSTARHRTSRLAIYSGAGFDRVVGEYLTGYLPLLCDIVSSLNSHPKFYKSAVDRQKKSWRPRDVEMAAYY